MALFATTPPQTIRVYTPEEIVDIFFKLQECGGDPSTVFVRHGYKISWVSEVLTLAKALESAGLAILRQQPDIDETAWYATLFQMLFETSALSDKQKGYFSGLSQAQFRQMAQEIIFSNPLPYDDTRTFDAMKADILTGEPVTEDI